MTGMTGVVPHVPPTSQWNTRLKHGRMADAVLDMAEAATEEGLWEWFRTVKPKKEEGFIWMTDDNINRITKHPYFERSVMHSGLSGAWTMRQIQYIAKHGFKSWDTL